MQETATKILASIIGVMGQQAYGHAVVHTANQMEERDTESVPSETSSELTEPVEQYNLELSNKPLDNGTLASLSAMFWDDD